MASFTWPTSVEGRLLLWVSLESTFEGSVFHQNTYLYMQLAIINVCMVQDQSYMYYTSITYKQCYLQHRGISRAMTQHTVLVGGFKRCASFFAAHLKERWPLFCLVELNRGMGTGSGVAQYIVHTIHVSLLQIVNALDWNWGACNFILCNMKYTYWIYSYCNSRLVNQNCAMECVSILA